MMNLGSKMSHSGCTLVQLFEPSGLSYLNVALTTVQCISCILSVDMHTCCLWVCMQFIVDAATVHVCTNRHGDDLLRQTHSTRTYDACTIRRASFTCAQKLTQVTLIYCSMEPTTKKWDCNMSTHTHHLVALCPGLPG